MEIPGSAELDDSARSAPALTGSLQPSQDRSSKIRYLASNLGLTEAQFLFLLAAKQGAVPMLAKLLQQGVEAELRDPSKQGCTALLHAASLGHLAAVQLLLDAGACMAATDSSGDSALHLACRQGHSAVATLLLSRGASLYVENDRGWSPIDELHQHPSLRAALLDADAHRQASLQPCPLTSIAEGPGLSPPPSSPLGAPLSFRILPRSRDANPCLSPCADRFRVSITVSVQSAVYQIADPSSLPFQDLQQHQQQQQSQQRMRAESSATTSTSTSVKALTLPATVTALADNSLTVEYVPTVGGEYALSVLLDGEHLAGSPFRFAIDAQESGNALALSQENLRLQALIRELTSAGHAKDDRLREQAAQLSHLREEVQSLQADISVLQQKFTQQEALVSDLAAQKQIHEREFAHLHRKFGGVINPETDNILKTGWGWKLPPRGGSVWQRRFFALFVNRQLTYFEEKGSINLLCCSKPHLVSDSRYVSLQSPSRSYSLFFEPSVGASPPAIAKRDTSSSSAAISRPTRESTRRSTTSIIGETGIFGEFSQDANMQWFSLISSLNEVDQSRLMTPKSNLESPRQT